ncbi:hypothetical protein HPB50_023709 [Hyalomma asiaticum]|uniref:Uncharacterized protein n=1 Tax=Hyalomma asiaticum TaxID=266040 RepID=A0ACB7T4J5_HYAAI|nr:hypothetical protein HPB50_023709 [Hyalomma asiaticum]
MRTGVPELFLGTVPERTNGRHGGSDDSPPRTREPGFEKHKALMRTIVCTQRTDARDDDDDQQETLHRRDAEWTQPAVTGASTGGLGRGIPSKEKQEFADLLPVPVVMLRLALLACLCLQQLPTSLADEVVLASQAPAASAADDFNGTLSAEMLRAAAALAGVNITIINGTAYEEYEVPESAPLSESSSNDSVALMPAQQRASSDQKPATQEPSTAATAAPETGKRASRKHTRDRPKHRRSWHQPKMLLPAPQVNANDNATQTTTATTSSTMPSTTPTTTAANNTSSASPSVETTITSSSGPATRASCGPSTDEPLEDVVQRSVISGRKDFFLKSLRIQVDRLETLPAPAGKYVFECVASVDGNLLKERVEIDSPYGDFCRNDTECASRNAVCGSSLACRCDGGHPVHLNSSHVTCRAAAHLGWPCSYDEQCTYAANNSHCGSKGECDCVETFMMEASPLGNLVCVPRKTVSGPCNTDNDCKDIGAKCNPSGTCQCPPGTLENNGRCVGKMAAPPGLNNLSALLNVTAVTATTTAMNATTATTATGSLSAAANVTVAPSADPKKQHMPVRILKVREFPRGASVKEHPNDTVDNRAQNFDGSVVKVDVPVRDNDTTLGSQRMLTGDGCKLSCKHSAFILPAAALAFAALFVPPF